MLNTNKTIKTKFNKFKQIFFNNVCLTTFENNFFWSSSATKVPDKIWGCTRKTGIPVFIGKMSSISFNVFLWFPALTFISVILILNSRNRVSIKQNMCYVTENESLIPGLWNALILLNHSLYRSGFPSVSGNLNKPMFAFFLCLSYCTFLGTGIQPYFSFLSTSGNFGGFMTVFFQSISWLPSSTWFFVIIPVTFLYLQNKLSCFIALNFVFINRKILHNRSWENHITPYCVKTGSNTKFCCSAFLSIWHECRVLWAFPSFENQPTDLHCKSADWFPYESLSIKLLFYTEYWEIWHRKTA